ncbi:unnamed protein product, partial [Lampetra planeri]
ASGKIYDFPNDKARWKINFRNALNNLSKRFKMITDNSKNTEDPHKIYEITNTPNNSESQPTPVVQEDLDMTLGIYNSPTEYVPIEYNLMNNFMGLDLCNHPTGMFGQKILYKTSKLIVCCDLTRSPMVFLVGDRCQAEEYIHRTSAVSGCHPAAATAETHIQPLSNQPSYCKVNPVLSTPQEPNKFDLEISIHYRKKQMLKLTLNTTRFQLHFHHEDPELNAHCLCFPTTEGLLDHKQIEFTNRILTKIQRGVLLEVRDTGIYALRQDSCRVFANTGDPCVPHPEPRKLPQNTMVELLSFEKYVNELKQFKENMGGSPSYTINMCFGEMFPDGKPLEKKLIVVQVVPLICRHFHEMAQLEGASSLHSANLSLQISHNSLYDLINSAFGLPTAEEPARAAQPPLHHMEGFLSPCL